MNISSFKVRTRLLTGFSILLIMSVCIAVFAVRELGNLNETVNQLTTEDWETIQGATGLRSNIRTISARSTEFLLTDAADRPVVRAKLDDAGKQIQGLFEEMSHLDTENEDAMNGLKNIRDSYAPMQASVDKVLALAANPQTNAEATRVYLNETRPLVDAALEDAVALVKVHTADVMGSAAETRIEHAQSVKWIYGLLAGALAVGIFIAIFLARGIVRPLNAAMSVAEAIREGRLNNTIDTSGEDETGRLLATLDKMQTALIERDEKDADSRGQIAAINRAAGGHRVRAGRHGARGQRQLRDASPAMTRERSRRQAPQHVRRVRVRRGARIPRILGASSSAAKPSSATSSASPRADVKSGCRRPTTRSPT